MYLDLGNPEEQYWNAKHFYDFYVLFFRTAHWNVVDQYLVSLHKLLCNPKLQQTHVNQFLQVLS